MRRKLLIIFALLLSHVSLVTPDCPPDARGLNREGKLVCVELSKVNLRFPVITLYCLFVLCRTGVPGIEPRENVLEKAGDCWSWPATRRRTR